MQALVEFSEDGTLIRESQKELTDPVISRVWDVYTKLKRTEESHEVNTKKTSLVQPNRLVAYPLEIKNLRIFDQGPEPYQYLFANLLSTCPGQPQKNFAECPPSASRLRSPVERKLKQNRVASADCQQEAGRKRRKAGFQGLPCAERRGWHFFPNWFSLDIGNDSKYSWHPRKVPQVLPVLRRVWGRFLGENSFWLQPVKRGLLEHELLHFKGWKRRLSLSKVTVKRRKSEDYEYELRKMRLELCLVA